MDKLLTLINYSFLKLLFSLPRNAPRKFCPPKNGVSANNQQCFGSLTLNEWTSISVEQIPNDSNYRYKIRRNGIIITDLLNSAVQEFENVKAYLGSPWYPPADVIVRKLAIETYGPEEIILEEGRVFQGPG